MSIERITRSAPSRNFSGGHVGHGILQPLEDYRAMEGTRALNRQLVGFPLVMMLVGVVVLGFAVLWPDKANAASGTGLSPYGSSLQAVSPVPASIPFAGER